MMETAKIFENGKSQAVRLPKKFRFTGEEVFVHRVGRAVVLLPKDAARQTFLDGLDAFSDDFFKDGRESEVPAAGDADRNDGPVYTATCCSPLFPTDRRTREGRRAGSGDEQCPGVCTRARTGN